MRLDLTVTLGNILQAAAMLAGIAIAYMKLREQIVAIDTKLGPLWNEYTDRRQRTRREEERS